MKVLAETESLCPVCLGKIAAAYVVEDNNVYMQKECRRHGFFKTLVWRDAGFYEQWGQRSTHAEKTRRGKVPRGGCPYGCGLCNEHEGGTCTAVLEITYRCNMNCPVCFADSGSECFEPDLKKIRKMYNAVLNNGGPCSVQLSGGEPTVRNDLPDIIRMGKELGFDHIQVNTNGIRIAEDLSYLRRLKESGANLIYLQFDGVSDDIYEQIRGRRMLDLKLRAVDNCREVNIGVLLVPTIIAGINLNQIGEIINFAKEQMPVVKGIHFQPISYFGRFPPINPQNAGRVTLPDIIMGMESQTGGEILSDHIVPRKRFDSHCAFSSLFYLREDGRLEAITGNSQESDAGDKEVDFVAKANKYTKNYWQMGNEQPSPNRESAWGRFAGRLKEYTLSITGMPFQDAWNIDLGRLKGCCVHVIDSRDRAVPLCAFHLTSTSGKRLYRNE